MSYNRNTAKTKALSRVQESKAIQVPNIHGWGVMPPPFTPRCRHCGSKVTAREIRCSTCWRPL